MTWSFGAIGVGLADDPRRLLPVFSFLPNWKDTVTERLAWLTDVMSSERAVEQRRTVRRHPRRTFEAQILRTDVARARLDSFFVGVGMGKFLCPLWHEQFSLPPQDPMLAAGVVQFPAGSLAMREFRDNDLVIIMGRDPADFDVLTVTALDVEVDQITLTAAGPIKQWPNGSRIIPLRTVQLTDAPQMTMPVDRVGRVGVRVQLLEPEKFPIASWNFDAPLWWRRPDRREDITLDYMRTVFELDFDAGVVSRSDPGGRAQTGTKVAVRMFGRERVFRFREFLAAARGKAVRFYMPTFARDVMLRADIGGDTIMAEDRGLTAYLPGPQSARLILAVVFADGRPTMYREIDNVVPVTSAVSPFRVIGENITLTEPLPPIAQHEVGRIMFVQPVRFDQDGFELAHHVDDSAAISSSFTVRSTDRDDMPPIESVVTTGPYPLESTDDKMTTSATVHDGLLMTVPIDDMSSAASVGDGTLESTFKEYEAPPEDELVTGGSVLDGDIESVFKTYDAPPEDDMATSGSVDDGDISQVLITYDEPNENLTTAGSVGSGDLS